MTALSPPLRRESTRGILFLVAGVAVFSLQDVILKWLSGDYPLHQAMVIRSLTAIPFLLGLLHLEGGTKLLFTAGTRAMIGRGLIMFLAYFTYYIALPALPLATTVALYFSAPLFITILSVVLLKEHVGPRRWIALALVVFAGAEYGNGSSRDWAAKGTSLLGVRAVITESFERIHRSNLIGMGVLPLQFPVGETASSLGLDGTEIFDIVGVEKLNEGVTPKTVRVTARPSEHSPSGKQTVSFDAVVRIDTPGEADYYRNGGILQYVLRSLVG